MMKALVFALLGVLALATTVRADDYMDDPPPRDVNYGTYGHQDKLPQDTYWNHDSASANLRPSFFILIALLVLATFVAVANADDKAGKDAAKDGNNGKGNDPTDSWDDHQWEEEDTWKPPPPPPKVDLGVDDNSLLLSPWGGVEPQDVSASGQLAPLAPVAVGLASAVAYIFV